MNTKYYGIAGSVLFHLILLMIAFLINYTIVPASILRRIELIEFGISETANNERFISPLSQPSGQIPAEQIGSRSNLIPKKVNMPKTFSQSEEQSYLPEHGKTALNNLELDQKIGNTLEKRAANLSENILSSQQKIDEKAVASTNNEYLSSLTNRLLGDSGSASPYLLEGDIISRQIMNKVIPAYPEGVQINARVKISFEVLPNGDVTNMVILQKADPRLELASLNALSSWKFNALLQDVVQKGVITFIYELK